MIFIIYNITGSCFQKNQIYQHTVRTLIIRLNPAVDTFYVFENLALSKISYLVFGS